MRPPSAAIVRCELSFLERAPIDPARALAQHRAYFALLAELGVRVIALAPEEDLPDAVFVEDAAVVVDELAVITRPGAPSRRPEVASVARALGEHRALVSIDAPGTLDGGDVLVAERRVWVGRSQRSNDSGIAQLAAALAPFGYETRAVAVSACLHFKSAVSYLGRGTMLANPRWVDVALLSPARVIEVPEDEPFGANAIVLGERVLIASSHPRTLSRVREAGFEARALDVSELMKAEAGLSCLSIRFRQA